MSISVAQMRFRHILCIDDMTVECGQIVKARGSNGVGKTSFLEGVKTLYNGLSAKLIMDGADSAETCFVLTNGWQVNNKIKRNGKPTREVLTPDGAVIRSPASWIDSRLNPDSFNPAKFLQSSSKEQIDQLLRISKLKLTKQEFLDAIAGCDTPDYLSLDDAPDELTSPLMLIEIAYKEIYQQRTATNAIVKRDNGHIATLEKSVPAKMDVPPDPAEFREELDKVREQLQAEREVILQRAARDREDHTSEFQAISDEAKELMNRKIAEAKAEYEATMSGARDEKDKRLEASRRSAEAAFSEMQQRFGPLVAELNQKMAIAETELREYDAIQQRKQDIKQAKAMRDIYEKKSEAETAALNNLKALKIKMMESLPVPGLAISDGELRYNDHLFETTNTAKRVEIALQIALANANPEFKLIQIDSLECLDSESQAAVEEWAKAHCDAQFFVAAVRGPEYDDEGNMTYDGSLSIDTTPFENAVRPA
jgi:hypothetical protein